MATKAKSVSERRQQGVPSCQVQVLLTGIEPPVWRRLQVPATATLGWFHAVLQVAMGWTNSHLHQFSLGERLYGDPADGLERSEGSAAVLDENKFTLAEVLRDHQELVYEYDFGDSWQHLVTVEEMLPANASTPPTALCLGGARACPPEDCGGPWGYMELLEALKNKKHPEHRSMKEWLGRPFDPETFNLAITNHWLRKLKWPRVTEDQLRRVLMARDGY